MFTVLSSNRSCRLPRATTPVFYIGGNVIEFVNEWSHLGYVISTSGDDMHDIKSRKSSLICQINGILCDFRNVTCKTKIRLIKTYCTSLYGAELWDLSNNYIDSICIAWRLGRKVWRLPNTAHLSLLPGISNTMPLIDLLYRRFLKFVCRCLSSRSFVLNFIARPSILFCRMNFLVGRNVLSCCQGYSTNIDSVIAFRFNIENIDHIANTASDDVYNRVTMLKVLLQCRDGMLCLSDNSFSNNDVEQLISFLCTS